jgi:16S rRNA (cytosine967-C5)-methyltransferase
MDETAAFARANNEAAPVAFRVNSLRASQREVLEELRAAGGQLVSSLIAPGAWRIEGAGASLRESARAGKVYLQDEASQLVAHLLDAQPGERILDVCAAPGSKTTHIATMTPEISLIVAGDVHEHRLRTVVESGARQGIKRLSVVAHNAETALPFTAGSFDRVLVDAPCAGTGTLRRNPEIRWRITARDISVSSMRQQSILSNAASMLKPGGHLVYSTCSVEREENEDVVSRFLNENAGFRQLPLKVPASLLTAGNAARIWPHREGADGFFIASFKRRS